MSAMGCRDVFVVHGVCMVRAWCVHGVCMVCACERWETESMRVCVRWSSVYEFVICVCGRDLMLYVCDWTCYMCAVCVRCADVCVWVCAVFGTTVSARREQGHLRRVWAVGRVCRHWST